MIPFNGKKNLKKKEKTIPYGLRHDTIGWKKELKEKRETNSLWIKTCFQALAEGT